MNEISIDQLHADMQAQGVPKEHIAFKCVMCETLQSPATLIRAGAGKTLEGVEKYVGFSCVGRWAEKPQPPSRDERRNEVQSLPARDARETERQGMRLDARWSFRRSWARGCRPQEAKTLMESTIPTEETEP